MSEVIKCNGFQLRTLHVPLFTLYRSEYLSLNFPNAYNTDEESQLVEILTGFKRIASVEVFELISFVAFNVRCTFFNQLFSRSNNPFSFLKNRTDLSDGAIEAVLTSLEIRVDEKLCSLGASEKKLLALEVVCNTTNNIIINCSGLDYRGISKLRERIAPRLREGSVVELNYLNSKGRGYLFEADQYTKRKVIDLQLL